MELKVQSDQGHGTASVPGVMEKARALQFRKKNAEVCVFWRQGVDMIEVYKILWDVD